MASTPEHKFFSFLGSRPDLISSVVDRLPSEIFSPEGKDIIARKAYLDVQAQGTETEATQFVKIQLLALLGKEIGRSQKNGLDTSKIKYVTALLEEVEQAFEALPIESYDSATPRIRSVIPTGIEALDQQIQGLAKSDLGIVACPSGRGKSAVLVNFAVSAALSGFSVLYISVADQGKDELLPRFDSCILEKPIPASEDLLIKQHEQAVKRVGGKLWLADYTSQECSLSNIEQSIIQQSTDLVIVDHADDLTPPWGDPAVTRHSLRYIYMSLKKLASKYEIPIWTASQTHEQSWGMAALGIDGLAEAKTAKATGAAIVLVLTGGQPYIEGQMVCTIAKARRAYTERTIRINVDHSVCRVW